MTLIEKLQQDAAKFKARFEADPKYKKKTGSPGSSASSRGRK